MSAAPVPAPALAAVETTLGARVLAMQAAPGGMINQAARLRTKKGAVFVKWNEAVSPLVFEAEAEGLRVLGKSGAVRTPAVLGVGANPPHLVLEWIKARPRPADSVRFARRLGEALARLHSRTRQTLFGFPSDNYIGSLPQINSPQTEEWGLFYRDCRLLPQIETARERGFLPPDRERLLIGVVERLPELLGDMPPGASLLHGDLWAGNFLCDENDAPVLIDPAAYFGPPEMEIAYTELFGGFPAGFHEAYRAHFPLAPGYERRRPLHQLYPLLVHLNHFGEEYGPMVERACRVL